MSGSLPSELGLLKGGNAPFVGLDFVYSGLTGTIPSELCLIEKLGAITIEANAITGRIPTEFGRMQMLNGLSLRTTGLTGPNSNRTWECCFFFKASTLDKLRCRGGIPSELGLLQHLGVLELSEMPLLTGSIPQEVSELDFQILRISGSNQLSGTIPDKHCNIGVDSCDLFYWWIEHRPDTCVLEFDCSDQLCGCECPCPNASLPTNATGSI